MNHPLLCHPIFARAAEEDNRSVIPLSMIDVVFNLLIFLLLGQFPVAEGLLSMPLAGPAPAAAPKPAHTLWIQVQPGQGGQLIYRLNDWPAIDSNEQLLGLVRDWVRASGAGQLAVVIGADPGVPFESLVSLWQACRDMGIEQLALPASGTNP